MVNAESIMDRRTRRLFVLLAIVSFIAAIGTLVFGRKVREFTPIATDSFTDGPLGNKAFVQIMEELDISTDRQRGAGRGHEALTWFIEPLRAEVPVPDGTARLRETLQERLDASYPSVMVLPKWFLGAQGKAEPVPVLHIQNLLGEVPPLAAGGLQVDRKGMPHEPAQSHVVITPVGEYNITVPWLQTMSLPPDFAPVIEVAETGEVLMAVSNDGMMSILSEPDLIHNFNIQRADHAAVFTGLAQWHGDTTFAVDEVFHGHAHTLSLRDALARWPVVLLPIHAIVLALLLVLRGVQRFGDPRDTSPPSANTQPDEGIRVSAMALTMSNNDARLLTRYVSAIFARIAHRNGLRTNTPLARAMEIDAHREARGLEPTAESLWRQVDDYSKQKSPNRNTRARLVRLAKQLLQQY